MWKHTIQSLALADGLPNLKGGLPPPADGLPLATNSDGSNLATTAAALVAFRIGLCVLAYPKSKIPNSNK